MDYNLFGTVKRIWALGKCAIEINYLLLLLFIKIDHNTGNYMPYSLRQVCGFFYVTQDYEH